MGIRDGCAVQGAVPDLLEGEALGGRVPGMDALREGCQEGIGEE